MTGSALRGSNQDERFHFLFHQLASKAVTAAQRFDALMGDFSRLQEAVADIRQAEHEADTLVHELESRLNNARVTPFDREDIHQLTGRLDDIVDHIEETADRLLIFRMEAANEPLRKLAGALLRCACETEDSIDALVRRDWRSLQDHCHQINEIENEADQILRAALYDLFSGQKDALEVIKWKEIYEFVERAVDACEDAADVLATAALKAS